jgi:hypothetical protein
LVLSQSSSKKEPDGRETSRSSPSSSTNEESQRAGVRKISIAAQYEAAVELAKKEGVGVGRGGGGVSSISADTTTKDKKKSESSSSSYPYDNSATESTERVLPDNWKEFVDPSNGKSYYFNSVTNTSQWEFPNDKKKNKDKEDKTNERDKEEEEKALISNRTSPSLLERVGDSETAVKHKVASKDAKIMTSIDKNNASTKKGEVTHSSSSSSSSIPTDTTTKKKKKSESSSSPYPASNSASAHESDNLAYLNPDPDPLPKEWKAKVDTATGKTYYYNSVTKKTQWKLPS